MSGTGIPGARTSRTAVQVFGSIHSAAWLAGASVASAIARYAVASAVNLALPVVLTALVALASRSAPRATHASTHPRAAATASSPTCDDADASGEASKHGSCEDGDRDGSDVGMGVCCMPASRRYASTYRDDGQSDGSVKAGGQTYSAEDELEADM